MTREHALRKVYACLRRAASSNPHEAATALRQACALQRQYGLTDDDVAAAEIRDADAPTRTRGKTPMQSTVQLAGMIADGYRCTIVIVEGVGRTAIRFFGAGSDPQIAVYAFTVLNRQLQADKAKHTRRIRKRGNKERRGEAFARGWVAAIRLLFPREALPEGRQAAIDAAVGRRFVATETTTGRELTRRGLSTGADRVAGFAAGRNAQLRDGLSASAQRRLTAT